jgi:hypothetical protein
MPLTARYVARRPRPLDAGFHAEVDEVDESSWYRLLREFEDASIYQTWAYGLVRSARGRISHLVLKKHGEVVAIAQSRIVELPVIGAGVAYVMWGPLWRSRHESGDAEAFRQAIRALRNEYACRRGLLVRVYPLLFEDDQEGFIATLKEEGFARAVADARSRTILMDLTPSLDELQSRLRPHWRRELKVAVKQKLELVDGVEDELFEEFIRMYREMVERKGFREPNDINEFREIQRRLPAEFRMRVMLCRSHEGLCAGLIASEIGSSALYLFGATSNVGMKSRGSYLLQWKLIEALKRAGMPQYDLNGINPEANPGTYKFKSDLAGDEGKDRRFLGRFEVCDSVVSLACVRAGEKLRAWAQALR